MRTRNILSHLLIVLCAISTNSLNIQAQQPQRTPASYTIEQADAGLASYSQNCASCHGENLDDGPFAPPLRGVEFQSKWQVRSLEVLFNETATTMPQDRPGSLSDDEYIHLLAFMLQENGIESSSTELPTDMSALATLSPGWRSQGGGLSAGVNLPPVPVRRNPLDSIRPVTDEMLQNADPGDWLLWRRTYDASGYSPLNKINTDNVSDMRVAWSWTLPAGPSEASPLVHDGVIFVHGYGDKVYAIDASTGDLLWHYVRRLPRHISPSLKRGMSLYENKLYVPTSDMHVIALDVKTGSVIWDQTVVENPDASNRQRLTGGTMVARGKIMIGTTGRAEGGNYIVALNAETGKEEWRFNTIPPPDAPGGNSWNGLPQADRNGGSVWIPGSYDPAHNLAFFGPGNTYDTAPLRDPINEKGITNDGLYLDTTLALDPDTGELAWHFQHQANGQWDLDWAFERQIIDLPVNGTPTSVVVTAGKQAIFDIVATDTGKYISSIDLGLQNGITSINPTTGEKIVDPQLIPGDGENKMVCPHVGGGRSWSPTAFNPKTKVVYVPITEACMDMVPVAEGERGSLSTGVRWTVRPRPESDGSYGRIEAVNLETQETVWIARQRAPQTTGALVTEGGLVFAGSLDRRFSAYDANTGDRLWDTRLNDVPNAPPIAYSANGQDYVAVIVGAGGYLTGAYSVLAPEIQNPPDRGATLWVFEVPTN
mgnify:CR=1 FL=1